MERVGLVSQVHSSFSFHSVAEGSDIISEVEEIKEVNKLKQFGEKALISQEFSEALAFYNDALEIDEVNADALCGRAEVYVNLNKHLLAQQDVEKVLSIQPKNAKALEVYGQALGALGCYRESLVAYLKAFDLTSDPDHAETLSEPVSVMATKYCPMPDEVVNNLPGMDSYRRLCEVAVCLFQSRRYDMCIRVLNAAQRLQTNQKGITMKVQLTLANAHALLKHKELAVSIYQDCLSTALSAHDAQYETKALVSIASLLLEMGDTHQAITYYEQLLHLQSELQVYEDGEDSPLPDYWSKDLQCALQLNLSIAYKQIGSVEQALHHAQTYVDLMRGRGEQLLKKNAEGLSHQNLGILYEILGDFLPALKHYETFLSMSRKSGDKKAVAQAYGCLGSVYAHLSNVRLAKTFHEQHVNVARSLKDHNQLIVAHEQHGDTLMLLGQHDEAAKVYTEMLHACSRSEPRHQSVALCKVGIAFKAQKKNQYSIYYFDQAIQLAEDYGYDSVRTMCEYHLATILQGSTQMLELDRAKKFLHRLIPLLEGKVVQHAEEGTFCPAELRDQLVDCYYGMQNVCAKLDDKEECLMYAEASRARFSQDGGALTNSALRYSTQKGGNVGFGCNVDQWSMDRVAQIVSQQRATIVYYTILPTSVLMWVLQPGKGLVRFYASRSHDPEQNLNDVVKELIYSFKKELTENKFDCEYRCLPPQNMEIEVKKKVYSKLASSSPKDVPRGAQGENKGGKASANAKVSQPVRSTQQKLFKLLLSPVYDILSELPPDSPLLFIPDQALFECPFSVIEDWSSKLLGDKFRISVAPNMHVVEQIVSNELKQLQLQDQVDFERTQSKKGGILKFMGGMGHGGYPASTDRCVTFETSDGGRSSESDVVDLKRVSNPRLATSVSPRNEIVHGTPSDNLASDRTTPTRSIKNSTGKARSKPLSAVPEASIQGKLSKGAGTARTPRRVHAVGLPTGLEKVLGVQTMTTLTTETSTKTDVTTSSHIVTEFRQVSGRERCCVIGSPKFPDSLTLCKREWKPPTVMKVAQKECFSVADHFDATAIVGRDATKERFLHEIQTATMVHIATLADLKQGYLAFAPTPKQSSDGQGSYIVTAEEISSSKMAAQLVVISGGWSSSAGDLNFVDEGFKLATAFLAAGAQCVLWLLWSLPDPALEKFYHHFYSSLRTGHQVATAVRDAAKILKDDNRFSDIAYWCPFVLVGKDVHVNVHTVQQCMLDQQIDRAEQAVAERLGKDLLNPSSATPYVLTKEENLSELQVGVATLLADHPKQTEAITKLIDLIDGSLKRLHVQENNQRPTVLPNTVMESGGAMKLLHLLGFQFQAKGAYLTDPYVVYPHWNMDELLVPAYDGLRALLDIVSCAACCKVLIDLLPVSQENISHLVDLLCITRHAQDVQLKVSDLTIKPLWGDPKVKAILTAMGFHQIGVLLNFNNSLSNSKLLGAHLQLFLSLSAHKSSVLLHKLDMQLLGNHHSNKGSSYASGDEVRLPSLTPLLLPRNQLRMSTPWLSTVEKANEMNEKMKLSTSKSTLYSDLQSELSRAKTWHQTTLATQGNEILSKVGRPKTTPVKVKVMAGSSGSCNRKPTETDATLDIGDTDQRRDYAHFVLEKRLDNVGLRHRNDVRKLYLPYVANA